MERASESGNLHHLSDALNNFRCYKDADIENFLQHKAITFLERGWCSVYLILDEDSFNAGKIEIDAYFTLSHKTLIPAGASRSAIQSAGGFKDADSIHFVLIGQLGKYMAATGEARDRCVAVTSQEILDFAFEIVRFSSSLIPCRCVLVECNDNPKIQKVYADYGFSLFQRDGERFQLYKRI